jgi:hypothetical protein
VKLNNGDSPLDFETQPSFSCTFRVKDSGGEQADRLEQFTVADVAEDPVVLWPFAILYSDNGCTGAFRIFDSLNHRTIGTSVTSGQLSYPNGVNVPVYGNVNSVMLGAGTMCCCLLALANELSLCVPR